MPIDTDAMLRADLPASCPQPPRSVRVAARKLMIARHGEPAEKAKLGRIELLPRPWLPASCPPPLLRVLLLWLDGVASWINHDYAWQLGKPIPACWPAHPHIVHELAGLAWLRVLAEDALDAGPLEDWHRYALPGFTARLADRLGDSCNTGHDEWPGRSRHTGFNSQPAVDARQATIEDLARQQAERHRRQQRRAGTSMGEQLELGDEPAIDEPDGEDPDGEDLDMPSDDESGRE